jgi:hypothetical protein
MNLILSRRSKAGRADIRTTRLYFRPSAKDSEDAVRHIQIHEQTRLFRHGSRDRDGRALL